MTIQGFEKFGERARRTQFRVYIDKIIRWTALVAAVQTAYPKVSERGVRPPIPLDRMLRMCFFKLRFNVSDPAAAEALYDSVAMRDFVEIDLGIEGARRCRQSQEADPHGAGLRRRSTQSGGVALSAYGREMRGYGDQGYEGQTVVIHERAPQGNDFTNGRSRFHGWINEIEKAQSWDKSLVQTRSGICSA